MSFHGNDSALGSSNLYLDGVPFKIGEKFKPPSKVTLPETLTHTSVTAALTEEYTFSTEDGVLAWIADLRQAEEVKQQQELEHAQLEAESHHGESHSSDENDETEVKQIHDSSWSDQTNNIAKQVNSSNWNNQSSVSASSNWSNPVLVNFSSDLLKPTPISSNSSSAVQKTNVTQGNDFDIKSFDKVDDPFDNLELQVLDDFEELKTVLQGSQHVVNNDNNVVTMQKDNLTERDSNDNINNCASGSLVQTRKNAVKLKRHIMDNVQSLHSSDGNSASLLDGNFLPDYENVQLLCSEENKQELSVHLPPKENMPPVTQRNTVALPPIRGAHNSNLLRQTDKTNAEQILRPSSNPELQLLGNSKVLFKKESGVYENVATCDPPVKLNKTSDSANVYSRHSISVDNHDYENVLTLHNPGQDKRSSETASSIIRRNGLRGASSSPSLVLKDTLTSVPSPIRQSSPSNPTNKQEVTAMNQDTCNSQAPFENKQTANIQTKKQADETFVKQLCDSSPPSESQNTCVNTAAPVPSLEKPVAVTTHGTPAILSSDVANTTTTKSEQSILEEGRNVGRSTFYENLPFHLSTGANSSTDEVWSKYRPLPAPRGQNQQITPVVPSRLGKDSTTGSETRRRSSSSSSTHSITHSFSVTEDPYSSLSIEAQAFVNSLTGMGFPRPRAARAVLKLGQDHKLVVEHLCLINTMVERGYPAPLSEMALHLFTNDFDKAVKYLDLYTQFQELGFQNDRIKEALVRNNIDRDKALDFLTA